MGPLLWAPPHKIKTHRHQARGFHRSAVGESWCWLRLWWVPGQKHEKEAALRRAFRVGAMRRVDLMRLHTPHARAASCKQQAAGCTACRGGLPFTAVGLSGPIGPMGDEGLRVADGGSARRDFHHIDDLQ